MGISASTRSHQPSSDSPLFGAKTRRIDSMDFQEMLRKLEKESGASVLGGSWSDHKLTKGFTPLKINMGHNRQISFLSKSVICRFHVDLPGCKDHQNEDTNDIARWPFVLFCRPFNPIFFRFVLTILFLAGMVLLLDLLSTMCSHQAICGQRSEDSGVVWLVEVDRGPRVTSVDSF